MTPNLYHATTDLHHDAEKHPFGERMANGTITQQEWTDWLGAMSQIHLAIDPYLHPSLKRGHDVAMDLMMMLPLTPNYSTAAAEALTNLDQNPELIGGLCYILSGANLRGGQVIRRKLEPIGFPVHHLTFAPEDALPADRWLKKLRDATGVAGGAQDAFRAVLRVMDEIDARSVQRQAA